jgi:hypothetical protein
VARKARHALDRQVRVTVIGVPPQCHVAFEPERADEFTKRALGAIARCRHRGCQVGVPDVEHVDLGLMPRTERDGVAERVRRPQ